MLPTFPLTPDDYRIYIGVRDDHPDVDPAEYVVFLHQSRGQICHWFYARTEPTGEQRQCTATWDRSEKHHLHCNNLHKQQFIGYLQRRDLKLFEKCFYYTKARSHAQFTIFRWLWLCVEEGLLSEKDVNRVMPQFQLQGLSGEFIDSSC
ncbi:hypothetical protein BJX76DRAFT_357827 [Aspergillus varians]